MINHAVPTLTKEVILKYTTPNVVRKWKSLGSTGFGIPVSKLKEIESTTISDEEYLAIIINMWLQGIGQPPSWRMLIYALDKIEENEVANTLMKFTEPQQGI